MQVRLNTSNAKNQNFGRLSQSLAKCAEWSIEQGSNPKILMGVVDEINALTKGNIVDVYDKGKPDINGGLKEVISIRENGIWGLLSGRKPLGDALQYDSSDPINFFKAILERLKTHKN